MKPYSTAPLLAALTFAATTIAQAAAPSVQLHLTGAIVTGTGSKATVRAADRPVKAGEILRYTIVARNVGTAPAYQLAPLGKVPARTEFVKLDEAPNGARVAYTSDGVRWTASPRHARMIRWTLSTPLAPSRSATFAYEVRVK